MEMTRESAYMLLRQYVNSENLLKHALAVEATMREFSTLYGGDTEEWGIVGLLHDIDYELYPAEHTKKGAEILTDAGVPSDIVRAVQSHGYGLCSDVEPLSDMEKTIYAIDELTGLITACVLVRPSKSILDLTVKSVRKKWKDKAFAAGANREVMQNGADRLGMELSVMIQHTINGMTRVAKELGLSGEE